MHRWTRTLTFFRDSWHWRRMTTGSLLLCVVVATVLTSCSCDVVVLDDSNFEHLTQASTGATTGDWFVKFYAPWCGHCKRLAPTWEKLADDQRVVEAGTVNIGKADGTVSPQLQTRFRISSYPTLKFFSKGRLYSYDGPRTLDALIDYAIGDFVGTDSEPVPAPEPMMDQIERHMRAAWDEATELLENKKNASIVIFAAGIVAGVVLLGVLRLFTGSKVGALQKEIATLKKDKKKNY